MTAKGDSENGNDASAKPPPRRPYRSPSLRPLGSVRELTLGGSMGMQEDGGSFIMMM